MKPLIYIVTLVSFLLMVVDTLPAQTKFQKTYGGSDYDWSRSIAKSSDSCFVIAGQTKSYGAGNVDVYVIKVNNNGDTIWTKTFGEVGDEEGNNVIQTNDSGYIISGFTSSFGIASWDIYLVKTNTGGELQWTKTYGGVGTEWGQSVIQTNDNGYIILGTTSSYGEGNWDMYLIKINTVGDTIWTKTFGGIISDEGFSVRQTSDNGFILCGITTSFGAGGSDVFLVKTDSMGSLQWARTYGGSGNEWGNSVEQTADSGYIIAGYYNSFPSIQGEIYLLKINGNGDVTWAKSIDGSPASNNDVMYNAQQTPDGGYLLVGPLFGAYIATLLIKFDPNGDSLWSKTIDDSYSFGFQQAYDGGIVIAGISYTSFNDVYIIRADSTGHSLCDQGNHAIVLRSAPTQTSLVSPAINFGSMITSPLSLSSSGCKIDSSCSINTGINNINNNDFFSVSPNPANNFISIQFKDNLIYGVVEIYSILGESMIREKISFTQIKIIDLNMLTDGIYFIKVIGDQQEACQKIIVRN